MSDVEELSGQEQDIMHSALLRSTECVGVMVHPDELNKLQSQVATIERLQADITRLEGGLQDIASVDRPFCHASGGYEAAIERIIDRARTALENPHVKG